MPDLAPSGPSIDHRPTLRTLGTFALTAADGTVLLGPGKPLALLAWLHAAPGRTATRDQLVDLLWADADPDRARPAVRQALWTLRQFLGEGAFTGRDEVHLGVDVASDRDAFLAAIAANDLPTALAHYGGAFIPSFAAPGGATFEHWADAERLHLASTFLRATELHGRRLLAAGHARDAVSLARRAVECDQFAQAPRRLLLDALLAAHDLISAASEAESLRGWAIRQELTLEPATNALILRAIGRSATVGPEEVPSPARVTADLVGREQEFAQILAAWQEARTGALQHVHLVGLAGIGKSRLLSDLEGRLKSIGARVRYVRAHPGDRSVTDALVSEIARTLASLPGAKGISPEVGATLVALDPSLATTFGPATDPASGNEANRRRILALTELARAVADEGPFALLIDDLHWSDPSSVALLEATVARLDRAPMLLVTAARPTGDQQLRSEHRQTISLAPLTAAQVRALLDSLAAFASEDDGQTITHQLLRATGGNPLQIVELLALAQERDLLVVTGGRWRLNANPTTTIFREKEGIRQRLERLAPDNLAMIQLLAIAGAPVPVAVAASGSNQDDAVTSQQLHFLERIGLARRVAAGWEPAHDEIAESAPEIDPDEVHRMHTALAGALEPHVDGDPSTLRRVARHRLAADDIPSIARLATRLIDGREFAPGREGVDAALTWLLGDAVSPQLLMAISPHLPPRARWSLLRVGVIAALAIIAFGIVGWRWSHTRAAASALAERSIVFEAIWESDGYPSWRSARIMVDPTRWDPLTPLTWSAPVTRAAPFLNWQMRSDYSPDGTALLGSSTEDSALSGSQDILLSRNSGIELLSSYPRDDVAPRWAVDGRGFFFVTTRWSGAHEDDYSIAYRTLADTLIHVVANTDIREEFPLQSPDGTRVAFTRYPGGGSGEMRICVATFGGADTHCADIPGVSGVEALAWENDGDLLVRVIERGGQSVSRLSLRTGALSRVLRFGVVGVVVDKGGEFLLCVCENPADGELGLYLAPLESPERGQWLRPPSSFPVSQVLAVQGRNRNRYLDQLRIVGDTSVLVGQRQRLRAIGSNALGLPIPFDSTTLRWRIVGGAGASIDSLTGELTALGSGPLVVEVTAGGWRTARAALVARPLATSLLLREDWRDNEWPSRWRAFGRPSPDVATDPAGATRLHLNGDRTYHSGVYSTTTWNPSGGLTVEAELSTPINLPKHQNIAFGFRAATDREVLARWDHRTGSHPGERASAVGECMFGAPGAEGTPGQPTAVLSAGSRYKPVSGVTIGASDARHTWRLTVFPDGRCGLALDSVAIAITERSISMDWPLRVWILSQAHLTDFSVGSLRVWQGDPGGVNWETILDH